MVRGFQWVVGMVVGLRWMGSRDGEMRRRL